MVVSDKKNFTNYVSALNISFKGIEAEGTVCGGGVFINGGKPSLGPFYQLTFPKLPVHTLVLLVLGC